MSHAVRNFGFSPSGACVLAALLALILWAASCRKPQKAETAGQKTFASPEEAGAALLVAAQSGDQTSLIALFGRDSKTVLFTGRVETDRARLDELVAAYNKMHRWGPIKGGGEVLHVGTDNYLFRIPLDRNSSGRWYFRHCCP